MSTTRVNITALLYLMVCAVLFGIGVVLVLSMPTLSAHAMGLIPVVVIGSGALALPISWYLAPRLLARYGRERLAPRLE